MQKNSIMFMSLFLDLKNLGSNPGSKRRKDKFFLTNVKKS